MLSKILLVDDEPKEFFKEAIEMEGLGLVLLADNGEEALEVIQKENPQLMVLNLRMPKMGGEELLEILKERELLNSLSVIIWTGWDDCGITQSRIRSNFSIKYYLDKPVDLFDLLDKIKFALNKYSE